MTVMSVQAKLSLLVISSPSAMSAMSAKITGLSLYGFWRAAMPHGDAGSEGDGQHDGGAGDDQWCPASHNILFHLAFCKDNPFPAYRGERLIIVLVLVFDYDYEYEHEHEYEYEYERLGITISRSLPW